MPYGLAVREVAGALSQTSRLVPQTLIRIRPIDAVGANRSDGRASRRLKTRASDWTALRPRLSKDLAV